MERENISTGNQPKGSARNVSDTLDREGEPTATGQRALNPDSISDTKAPPMAPEGQRSGLEEGDQ